jgi:hypothetical protein
VTDSFLFDSTACPLSNRHLSCTMEAWCSVRGRARELSFGVPVQPQTRDNPKDFLPKASRFHWIHMSPALSVAASRRPHVLHMALSLPASPRPRLSLATGWKERENVSSVTRCPGPPRSIAQASRGPLSPGSSGKCHGRWHPKS